MTDNPILAEYEADPDPNAWWSLGSGSHLNLFEEACDERDAAVARAERAEAALTDLRERLAEKAPLLRGRALSHRKPSETSRLNGKAEGLAVAVSYVDEVLSNLAAAGEQGGEG